MAAFLWHKVAAISGITAIVAGTFGSHGFKPTDPVYKTVWQTGNLYHLVHTSALLVAPYTKRPHLVQFGSLLTFGIAAFSGTYQKNTKNGYSSHVGCMSWH
uniref:Transmembrane protein 256 homolog n=1 Tax=Physcomitrium patens TaxID=3218 RepID=A0A7I4F775_PHYPA